MMILLTERMRGTSTPMRKTANPSITKTGAPFTMKNYGICGTV